MASMRDLKIRRHDFLYEIHAYQLRMELIIVQFIFHGLLRIETTLNFKTTLLSALVDMLHRLHERCLQRHAMIIAFTVNLGNENPSSLKQKMAPCILRT